MLAHATYSEPIADSAGVDSSPYVLELTYPNPTVRTSRLVKLSDSSMVLDSEGRHIQALRLSVNSPYSGYIYIHPMLESTFQIAGRHRIPECQYDGVHDEQAMAQHIVPGDATAVLFLKAWGCDPRAIVPR